jgi:predicted glycogen debranching enzyme
VRTTGNESLVDELWVTLEAIVRWHLNGTRYGIGVDPSDGLLRAGEPGVQLTWMDAKIGDWVVTPRTGKPVEINALWYSALRTLEVWAASRKANHDYRTLADQVADSFARYWNKNTGYLFDVLDGPDGDDPSIRPNAVIAASFEHSPLENRWRKAVVDLASEKLLTPYGLRSLSPDDSRYAPRYLGSPLERDAVYHQGTVWAWLLGSFVEAHLRAYAHPRNARAFLEPIAEHLIQGGLGSVSEILDGDAPHAPRGCPWQAWSVAEILRAWKLTTPRSRKGRA